MGNDQSDNPNNAGDSHVPPPDLRRTDLSRSGPTPLLALGGPIIGIDLGTVNSCVAVAEKGQARVLQSPGGYSTVPSVVHISADNSVLVGHAAKDKMVLEPDRAVYGSKRFLGRPFASQEVASRAHFFNYALVPSARGRVAAQIHERTVPLEDIAAHILNHLKEIAEHDLGQPVQRAVVTVPAYFGENQRQAIRDAGRICGLHVERVVNEPTAAAVAYGFGRGLDETVLVYDFGGGTFDASLLRIEGNRTEVLAADGDAFLGGSDFDDRLTEFALMSFERKHSGTSFRDEAVPVQRLRFAAEMAKVQLSQATSADIELPYITQVDGKPVKLEVSIPRELLEDLTEDLVERSLGIVQSVLDTAKIQTSMNNDVILVGGQTRSPMVRRMLVERFNKKPTANIHPDEAVALGAALIADAMEQNTGIELVDILPASIRVGLRDNTSLILLPRGVRLPAEKRFEVTLNSAPQGNTAVVLYRGEQKIATNNTLLGKLRIPNVPANATNRKALITLSVSADGLFTARATHPDSGDSGDSGELDVLLL